MPGVASGFILNESLALVLDDELVAGLLAVVPYRLLDDAVSKIFDALVFDEAEGLGSPYLPAAEAVVVAAKRKQPNRTIRIRAPLCVSRSVTSCTEFRLREVRRNAIVGQCQPAITG